MERDISSLQKSFELNEDCRMDIPSVDPPTRHTFEEFRRDDIDAPNALPDAFFMAIDKDGRYLGVSNMFRSLDDPKFLWQGITGVPGRRAGGASPWRSSFGRCATRSTEASSTSRRGTTSTTSRCFRSTKPWASPSSRPGSRTRKTSSALAER